MNKSNELDRLVSRVDALLARLPQNQAPEIAQLRAKVDYTIFSTWLAVENDSARGAQRLILQRRAVSIAAAILVGIAAWNLLRRSLLLRTL